MGLSAVKDFRRYVVPFFNNIGVSRTNERNCYVSVTNECLRTVIMPQ